jgi:transcriptional regulator with XRE-family HTH domain
MNRKPRLDLSGTTSEDDLREGVEGSVQPALGERLRQARRYRRLSLAEVAASTRISQSFLSHVENGKSDITISRLMRLLRLYQITMTDLLPAKDHSRPQVLMRRADQPRLHVHGGVDVYLLAPNTDRIMMPFMSAYEPRGQTLEFLSHQGEEFAWVVEGLVGLKFADGEEVALEEGDSAYFEASRPHIYTNRGESIARVLSVVSPPSL